MGDISKRTLAMLLLIIIILSAIATWRIVSSEQERSNGTAESSKQTSYAVFNVTPESSKEPDQKSGLVSINIE